MVSGIMSGMSTSTNTTLKVRENRLRAAAQRQGLALVKSRRRDPRSLGFGRYALTDGEGEVVAGAASSGLPAFTLGDVEAYLTGRLQARAKPQLEDWLPDMLPGAEPQGAFRQVVKAWCDQERSIHSAMDETGIKLVPKSDDDREALLDRLAEIRKTAARLESQVRL
jgi:hypothetical protein